MVEPLNTKAWVMVPVQPTPEMVEAHYQAHAEAETVFADAQLVWAKMLSASPSLPVVDGGEVVATSWKYHDRVYVDFKFAPDPYALERGFLTDIEPLVRQSALLAAESRVLSLEEEVKVLREALKPVGTIALGILAEAPTNAHKVKIFTDSSEVPHYLSLDACRSICAALKENGNG